ncbi:MAG: hypothetical protein ACLFVP_06165 [Candidatus Bathyarchaeia archaeon]
MVVDVYKREVLHSNVDRHEYVGLTMKLIGVLVELCLLTLELLRKKKGSPLSVREIEDVVNFDLQFRIQQIHDPELMEIIREKAIMKFIERQGGLRD